MKDFLMKKVLQVAVQCKICPRMCLIAPGQSGFCRVRTNLDGEIRPLTYGQPCSIAVDPVEKKPLFHFLPASKILSLATVGCNLRCQFCQNWEISQALPSDISVYAATPEQLVAMARERGCRSIAYTYTDPTVYYEFARDCAVRARDAGVKNVLVTAAYINREPWQELCRYTDAANIDLKALSDKFYREVCGAELQPVLDALVTAKAMGVMLEVTNLVIPGLNDSDEELRGLTRWVKQNLGPETPLHFSRFFPQYRMLDRAPTPEATLRRAREIALSEGLNYVYIGNLITQGSENTYCPGCRALLVERQSYTVLKNSVTGDCCPQCGQPIPGVWR